MDRLYQTIFVSPFITLARINKKDIIDLLVGVLVSLTSFFNRMLVRTQTGYLRWYAASFMAGVVILMALGVLL
jgi:NADH-quinone oxidoreductase subunit L